MRIKEKKFNFILLMFYYSTIICMGYIQMKMVYSDELGKLPIIGKSNFEIAFSIIISLMSVFLIFKRIVKYKKVKNQTINIYIDTKSTKKIVLYMFLGLDIFLILIVIGLKDVLGLIILINAIIWNLLVVLWWKFDDGIYDIFLFYKGNVYPIEKIEECSIDRDKIGLTVLKKVLFLEVICKIDLVSNSQEIKNLISVLDFTKVETSANTTSAHGSTYRR